MKQWVYYNDVDPNVCAWIRELIKDGLLPEGEVDERPIEEVSPEDVKGFHHAHFFAGIGGWPYALRLAKFPQELGVWTGSCPCQPFSVAGKGLAEKDSRHLWPDWFRLIKYVRPQLIFGEQVASKLGRNWLARVRSDLQSAGYDVGAADLPASAVGAPHIRQRLWFVAELKSTS